MTATPLPMKIRRTIAVALTLVCGGVLTVLVLIAIAPVEVELGRLAVRWQRDDVVSLTPPESGLFATTRKAPAAEPIPDLRNVILVIGDGMGLASITTTSTLLFGPDGGLALEEAPVIGLVRTFAANNLVTDSGAAGTALATGYKSYKGAVSVDPERNEVLTLLEAAKANGLATGVLTTSYLFDATPATYTVHGVTRRDYSGLLVKMAGSSHDLLIGGDGGFDLAGTDPEQAELAAAVEEALARRGCTLVRTAAELATAELPLMGLLPSRNDGGEGHGPLLEVSLGRALKLLDVTERGFVLLVESEETDESAHAADPDWLTRAMRELDDAIRAALAFATSRNDTLVLVTADHDTASPNIVAGWVGRGSVRISWADNGHTSTWVPLFAFGLGSERFAGVMDNTEIGPRIANALGLEGYPDVLTPAAVDGE